MKEAESKQWTRIAFCDDIPLREGRAVTVGNRQIAIFNLGNRFLAVDNRCPHKSGPLADGIVSGVTVICPLHAWKMSLETGEGLSGASASSCVETFPTRVEHGVILLEMGHNCRKGQAEGTRELQLTCVDTAALAAADEPLRAS